MKAKTLRFKIIRGNEVATFDDFSNQDTEPNFDLVHPRSMFGRVMKNDAMRWVAQKGILGNLIF